MELTFLIMDVIIVCLDTTKMEAMIANSALQPSHIARHVSPIVALNAKTAII